jgi:RNA-directed DNA polymerase
MRYRTDVKSYYESINHEILLDKLSVYIKDKAVMNLPSTVFKTKCGIGRLV